MKRDRPSAGTRVTEASLGATAQRFCLLGLVALTVAFVLLGAVSFARKAQTFQPFGLDLRAQGAAWVVSDAVEPTDLESGDVLLLVNGEQVMSRAEVGEQLRRRAVSEILVERDGLLLTVRHELPPLDPDFPYLVLALSSVIYLFIGLYMLRRGISRQVVLFHLWCLASAAVYLLSPITPPGDRLDTTIYVVDEACRLLLPPLTLHFFLIFPQRLRLPPGLDAWLDRLVPLLYAPSAAIFAVQLDWIFAGGEWFTGFPTGARVMLVDRLELVLLVAFVLVSIAALVSHLQQAARWEHARQVTWITLGMGAGYVPFLVLYVMPFTAGLGPSEGMQVAAVAPLALVPLSFAYAILRYRLWDIAVIVRDVTTYTLTLLLGAVGFSLLNLLIRRNIPEDMELFRGVSTVASGILVAGLLIPTKQGISSTLERFHYRGSFGRRRALLQLGHELLHERDLDRLCAGLLQEIEGSMDLERCNIYLVETGLLEPVREEEPQAALVGDRALSLDDLDPEVWSKDYVYLHGTGLPAPERSVEHSLFLLGYRAAFPLTVRDRRVGLVVSGYKEGQVPLNSDDALLIRQLLNQASLAIENAQLLEQMQRQLREVLELKRFNEGIIESTPAGIAVLDDERRIVLANLAFAALVGYERGALKHRPLGQVLTVHRLPDPGGGLVETTFADPQGRERQLQLSIASFVGDRPHGLQVLVVNDVTEFAEMEKALAAKERLAALGIMAAGVAHEVNTPLTGICSYAQMLLAKTPEADPRHELLRKVERQTFRAARIVNSLLEFSRASQPDPQPVALGPALRECIDLLADRFQSQGARCVLDERKGDLSISGNESELQQVFTNVLVNALDAVHDRNGDGLVDVVLDGDGDDVTIDFTDNGPGVARDDMGKIFAPFFSTKTDRGGTGLGLSLSYEIVRRHGGEIQARNEPDGGCRFTVRLPRAGAPRRDPRSTR
jgi:two-component system, NtrC family, sensor kinase